MTQTGVVLMTYGSPRDLDDVGAYMTRVRGGRAPSAEDLDEFRRRYALIGMSPLIEITRQQAAGLQAALADEFRVAAGMRFSSQTDLIVTALLHVDPGLQIDRVIISTNGDRNQH